VTGRQPPMHPVAIREFIIGVLEDHENDEKVVPASRYADLAESLTESWLKDRRRAIGVAKDVPFR
jgi:hypothetical protein